MSIQTERTLNLRTGELNCFREGKEMLRGFRTRLSHNGPAFLNLKISFPMFNRQTREDFWLWAETVVDVFTAQNIVDFLKEWPKKSKIFRTGLVYDRSVSFKNDWLENEDVPSKKMRIIQPGIDGKPHKIAITHLTHEKSHELCDFMEKFIKDEWNTDDLSIEANGNENPEVDNLMKKIRCYDSQLDCVSKSRADVREKLDQILSRKDESVAI